MASLAQTQNGSSSPSPVSPNLTPRMSGGLRLITSDEPEFDYHVSSTYPQVADHRLYPRARNFMAVLSHEGSRQVKAYRVLWTIQQSPNRQRIMQSVFIRKHCMLREAVKVVKPGKKRLMSPFFNYSTSDYNFDPHRVFKPDGPEERILSRFPFLDAQVVSVSIDAVIYSDHTIAGPDKYDLRIRYLATRAAEHNEGSSLSWKLDMIKAALGPGESLDPAKIVSILDYDIQFGMALSAGTDKKSIIRFARSQEAALMKGLLSSRGLDAFEKNVARRMKYPAERLTAVG